MIPTSNARVRELLHSEKMADSLPRDFVLAQWSKRARHCGDARNVPDPFCIRAIGPRLVVRVVRISHVFSPDRIWSM